MLLFFNLRLWASNKLREFLKLDAHLESGIKISIRSSQEWYLFNEIFLLHEYDEAIDYTLSLKDKKELNVIDCGANVGFFTLRMLDRFLINDSHAKLNLYMIEAAPHLVKKLRLKMESIAFSNIKIQIISGLAGKRSGNSTFQLAKSGDVSNYVSESPLLDLDTRGKIKSLPYIDLEKVVGENTPIDLIKLDIEGSEFDFIKSYTALLRRTRVLVVEFHSDFGNVSEAIKNLSELGLSVLKTKYRSDKLSLVVFGSKTI